MAESATLFSKAFPARARGATPRMTARGFCEGDSGDLRGRLRDLTRTSLSKLDLPPARRAGNRRRLLRTRITPNDADDLHKLGAHRKIHPLPGRQLTQEPLVVRLLELA